MTFLNSVRKKGILAIKFTIISYCEHFYFVLLCFYVVGLHSPVALVFVSTQFIDITLPVKSPTHSIFLSYDMAG